MMVNFTPQVKGRLVGGVNLNQIDKKALRQYINYLPLNSPMFFNGTILDNSSPWSQGRDDQEDILRAVELAEIWGYRAHATELPDRIDPGWSRNFQVVNVRESLWRGLSLTMHRSWLWMRVPAVWLSWQRSELSIIHGFRQDLDFHRPPLDHCWADREGCCLDQGKIVEEGKHADLFAIGWILRPFGQWLERGEDETRILEK